MFGTALNYCVLRLLGVPADEPRMAKARAFIHLHGKRGGPFFACVRLPDYATSCINVGHALVSRWRCWDAVLGQVLAGGSERVLLGRPEPGTPRTLVRRSSRPTRAWPTRSCMRHARCKCRLLPDATPFHPGRYWCHTRQV